MAYEWNQDFEDGQTRAACSKCGVPYRWPSELVKLDDGFFYCKRRCLEQTVLSRDKLIAQSRKRREMPPPKFVQAPRYAEDYIDSEDWQFVAALAASSSTDATAIGWAVNYLADVVIEAKRPERWLVDARRVITSCCNTLLTLQYGAPTGPAPTLTVEKLRYGGFAYGSSLYSSATAIAGMALLKAYQILGIAMYLNAASRCAHFLRHMQCQDLDNNGQGSTYGGSAYHVGGFADSVSSTGAISWVPTYNIAGTLGALFLDLLAGVQGGGTTYGGVAGTDFTASTVATLDTMIAEALAFVTTGAKDAAFGGALKTGLSTTYPRSIYTSADSASSWGLTATLGNPSQVLLGADVALSLFALDAMGAAAVQVASVFDWLMTFTANPANAAPVQDPQLLIGNLKGTYNPKVALAAGLDVLDNDGVTPLAREHVGTGYSWAATGLLAGIASVRQPADFAASKNQLAILQPAQAGPAPTYQSMNTTGFSGLSFQIVSAATATSLAGVGTTAASSASSTATPAAPPTGSLLWFKADAGVTMNASNRVTQWADQSLNHFDVNNAATDPTRPLWTAAATPTGLPALDWGANIIADAPTSKRLTSIPTGGQFPTADGAPRTVVAIIKPGLNSDATRTGGVVITFRKTIFDMSFDMLQISGTQRAASDTGYNYELNSVVDYTNKWIVVGWTWGGTGSTTIGVTVNGVARPGNFPGGNIIRTDTGNYGFDIGMQEDYTKPTFSGMIAEIIGYTGTGAATLAAATAYAMGRAGITSTSPVGAFGTLYRSAPKAFGDRYFNPGQP